MPKTSSQYLDRVKKLLALGHRTDDEPVLEPIYRARYLLYADNKIDTDSGELAFYSTLRGAIRRWFMFHVDQSGWRSVPVPDVSTFARYLAGHLRNANVDGVRVLRSRDVEQVAAFWTEYVRKMWPAIVYFCVALFVYECFYAEERSPNVLYRIALEWRGKRNEKLPSIVEILPAEDDFFARLWLEAAVCLLPGADKASGATRDLLRAKAFGIAKNDVPKQEVLSRALTSILSSRLPEGRPVRAIGYVNSTIKNNLRKKEGHGASPVPFSTFMRYRQELPSNATSVQIAKLRYEKELARSHRREGLYTKNQAIEIFHIALDREVSRREMDKLLKEAERQIGKPPSREGNAMRLDVQWLGEIARALEVTHESLTAAINAEKIIRTEGKLSHGPAEFDTNPYEDTLDWILLDKEPSDSSGDDSSDLDDSE